MSLLIVRGTVDAVAAFRQKVLSLDVPQPTWTIQFRLIDPKTQNVLGLLAETSVFMDDSEVANISDGVAKHPYRFHLYPVLQGKVAVVLRTGVPTPNAGGATVFAPAVVWLSPVSKTTAFGSPVVFSDLASDRATVHNGLGATPNDPGSDYSVEITVTPNAASLAAPEAVVQPKGNNSADSQAPDITIKIDPPDTGAPLPAPNQSSGNKP
jgi:hypothetical protein